MRLKTMGVMYDTEKGIPLGKVENGDPRDPHWFCATVYKTPISHKFFLHGKGNFLTVFREATYKRLRVQKEIMSGERLIPISEPEAAYLLKEYGVLKTLENNPLE